MGVAAELKNSNLAHDVDGATWLRPSDESIQQTFAGDEPGVWSSMSTGFGPSPRSSGTVWEVWASSTVGRDSKPTIHPPSSKHVVLGQKRCLILKFKTGEASSESCTGFWDASTEPLLMRCPEPESSRTE
jgi:hypothetical protein